MVDLCLTGRQQEVQRAAREFAERELAPHARDNDRAQRAPVGLIRRMGEAGWLAPALPEAYGGRGLDMISYALVTEEIGRVDSSLRTALSITCSLVSLTVLAWGTREQQRRWLPELASGRAVGCFGLTEPQSGSVAAGCVGIMQASLEAATAYAGRRQAFDRPIAAFQLVQELLADIAVETEAARLLVWKAGDLKDRGEPSTAATSMAKLYASEGAVRAANAAIQVHGGYGYFDEYPVERYLRDARVATLYEGTTQIQKLIIGRHLTGLDAISP
jgi:alkylation response protein AidB-like acyl-CoA dehydrogenase